MESKAGVSESKSFFSKLQCIHVLPLANLVSTDNFVKTVSSSCKLFIKIRWRNSIFDDKRKKARAKNKYYRNFKQSLNTSKLCNRM